MGKRQHRRDYERMDRGEFTAEEWGAAFGGRSKVSEREPSGRLVLGIIAGTLALCFLGAHVLAWALKNGLIGG